MLSIILLSLGTLTAMSSTVVAWKTPWRPVFLPVKSGNSHKYANLVPHAVIRTKVVILEENTHKIEDSHSHSDEQNHHDTHSAHDDTHSSHGGHDEQDYRSYRYGYQKKEDNDREYQPFESIKDNQGYGSKQLGFKYSTPMALSSWKPISGPTTGYWPLKYLGEDENLVKAVLQKAVKEVEPDPKPHFILPTGMQTLHNPPLKKPYLMDEHGRYGNYRNSLYGNLGVHYDEDDDVRVLRKRRFRGKRKRRKKNHFKKY